MPKVLPEYLELRKQQIVDAAAACFTRAGFHQTTMQDICAEADLSPGAVYRYFRSKEEIIQAMCLRGHEEDAATIHDAMSSGTTEEIMNELVRIFFEGADNRELCALSIELLGETRRDPIVMASVREGMATTLESLGDVVRRAQERGEMSEDFDADAMGRVMMGLYQGLIWQKVIEPELDVRPYAQTVKALFAPHFIRGYEAATSPIGSASALQH